MSRQSTAIALLLLLNPLAVSGVETELAIENADDVFELNAVYNSIIRQSGDDALARLRNSENTGTALQAGWEGLRRSTPIPHHVDSEKWSRIDQRSLQRFLGVIEGRLRVRIPQWWERLISKTELSTDTYGNTWVRVVRINRDAPLTRIPLADGKGILWGPKCVGRIDVDNDELTLHVAQSRIQVPQLVERAWAVTVKDVTDGRWLVAQVSEGYAISSLLLVDAGSGEEIWRADVWGELPVVFKSGAGAFHWVELRTTGGNVCVFGALNNVLYVEGFSLADGTSLFRFSTSYCFKLD